MQSRLKSQDPGLAPAGAVGNGAEAGAEDRDHDCRQGLSVRPHRRAAVPVRRHALGEIGGEDEGDDHGGKGRVRPIIEAPGRQRAARRAQPGLHLISRDRRPSLCRRFPALPVKGRHPSIPRPSRHKAFAKSHESKFERVPEPAATKTSRRHECLAGTAAGAQPQRRPVPAGAHLPPRRPRPSPAAGTKAAGFQLSLRRRRIRHRRIHRQESRQRTADRQGRPHPSGALCPGQCTGLEAAFLFRRQILHVDAAGGGDPSGSYPQRRGAGGEIPAAGEGLRLRPLQHPQPAGDVLGRAVARKAIATAPPASPACSTPPSTGARAASWR